jgi:glyoxylase-like metal-dependent hydrolase (beta-lactamase superfamily II)
MTATWEVHALRYAMDPSRRAFQCLLGGQGGDVPMPVAYHVFLLRGPGGILVMDTGADAGRVARNGKQDVRSIEAALLALGGSPEGVRQVIQTHLHWDHAGQPGLFPAASFHMQAREMAYVNGPLMRHAALRAGYEAADIAAATALLHAGRLVLHDGLVQLADGISLHHVGGHTDGLQLARVRTRRGWMCLATDAIAHRPNLERACLPPCGPGETTRSPPSRSPSHWRTAGACHPGPHDPLVVDAHPAIAPGTAGGSRGWTEAHRHGPQDPSTARGAHRHALRCGARA